MVLDRAFAQLSLIRNRFGEKTGVSVNLSAAELSTGKFLDDLHPLVDKYGVPPSMITLEITETFYQEHSAVGLEVLKKLSDAGFNLAIDDFGSGYTSLLQIVEFPMHTVKLDRTFVVKTISTGKTSVLKSLVEFCHSQNLAVTAEGVETYEEMTILTQAGCDYLQGFYYSKPVPLDNLYHFTSGLAGSDQRDP